MAGEIGSERPDHGALRQEVVRLRGERPMNARETETMGGIPPARHPYHVEINRVENGFIITIGCKTLVANSWMYIAEALAEYWEDPEAAQEKYCR